jgi:hypothetical protein
MAGGHRSHRRGNGMGTGGRPRGVHPAKPRHPEACAWLDAAALTLGLGHDGHARSTLVSWTPTYGAAPFTTGMRWSDDASGCMWRHQSDRDASQNHPAQFFGILPATVAAALGAAFISVGVAAPAHADWCSALSSRDPD